MFDGLQMNLGNLFRTSEAKTRSLSPENITGEKGRGGMCELEDGSARHAARDLGKKWKVNPFLVIQPGETLTIADVAGPGCIQHIWMTPTGKWRNTILRMYWDGEQQPSVECPVGDFFASGWGEYAPLSSLAVCVNPGSAFNCYWPMPFRRSCRMTMENRGEELMTIYYQIDYTLTELPEDTAYFHAQFRRVNPLPYKQDYTILDQGAVCGHVSCLGRQQHRLVGRGRNQVFPGRRRGVSHCLRHRNRRLFLRLLQF